MLKNLLEKTIENKQVIRKKALLNVRLENTSLGWVSVIIYGEGNTEVKTK